MKRLMGIGLALMFVVVMVMPASTGMPAIGSAKAWNLTSDELEMIERLDYDHALDQLCTVIDDQLVPWLVEDVLSLEREWTNAAEPLEAVLQ